MEKGEGYRETVLILLREGAGFGVRYVEADVSLEERARWKAASRERTEWGPASVAVLRGASRDWREPHQDPRSILFRSG